LLKLSSIYAPINEGLKGVEDEFKLVSERRKQSFPEMAEMLDYILVGGKVLRPALSMLSAMCFGAGIKRVLPLATSSEMLHIATLVHDDAIDKADTRRSRRTVNSVWGLEKAILLGDFLFAHAAETAADTGNMRIVTLFAQTLQIIASGELKQAYASFNPDQSYENYLERISGKTAALFVMATKGGAILADASTADEEIMRSYGYNLGLSFQIVDDILDFVGNAKDMGKPIGSDLNNGTVTLPALLLMDRYPESNPIKDMLGATDRSAHVAKAVEMINSSDIIDLSYKEAKRYADLACKDLSKLPKTAARESLYQLAEFIVERKN
jgi:octaprenyl-diphosphate synthase